MLTTKAQRTRRFTKNGQSRLLCFFVFLRVLRVFVVRFSVDVVENESSFLQGKILPLKNV